METFCNPDENPQEIARRHETQANAVAAPAASALRRAAVPPALRPLHAAFFGFPFFYWYQFAWVLLASVIMAIVYLKTRD